MIIFYLQDTARVTNTARITGPYVRVSKNAPVHTALMYGAVCTGSAYRRIGLNTGRVHGCQK